MIFDASFWSLLFSLLFLVPVANVLGCCCGGTCAICSDDFNRSDDTDIDAGSACGWTESSGAWDITSNQLRCTTAGLAICDTAHPDAEHTMSVEVDFKHNTSASGVLVVVGYVDSNNYYYAKYLVGTNTITIHKVVAGTPTQLETYSQTMNTDTTYTAKVCVSQGGSITAFLDDVKKLTAWGEATGDQCGLGGEGSGTATFDNFVFDMGESGTRSCPNCAGVPPANCTGSCDGNDAPFTFKVVIAGITTGAGCDDCTPMNGIFFVDYSYVFGGSTSYCFWETEMGAITCSANVFEWLQLRIQKTGSTPSEIAIAGDKGPPGSNSSNSITGFYKNPGARDCAFEDEDIPENGNPNICNTSAATCAITTIAA